MSGSRRNTWTLGIGALAVLVLPFETRAAPAASAAAGVGGVFGVGEVFIHEGVGPIFEGVA